jgi:HemY protein
MVRVIFYVVLVFLVAAGAAWLADRPGTIVLAWQGQEIRTSLAVAALAFVVLIGLLALIGAVIRAILNSPRTFGEYIGARRRDRGYRALSAGMIAVGAGDARLARRAAEESTGLLAGEPLTLLLTAQAAQLAGDGDGARMAFEALAEDRGTRVLGLHGLFVEARRQGEHAAARHFAEEAARVAPQIGWAGTALFEYQSRAGDWLGALQTLSANASAKLVDKPEARRLRAVLLTARAMELEAGDPGEAQALALEAHRLAPDLTAAATTAARLLTRAGEIRRATRVLEAAWKVAPHPEIAEAYAAVRPGDTTRDRLKRVRRLADLRPDHVEGALAVARVAIDGRDWPAARAALRVEAELKPSERVCLLMAEIEEEEHGDQGRVRTWLTRALTAPRDPRWVADGHVFDRWGPVSPVTGRVGAFEWKVVREATVPRKSVVIETDSGMSQPAPALSLTPSEPGSGAVSEAEPAAVPLAPLRLESAVPGRPPPVAAAQGPGPTRPPDDPGPPDEEGERAALRPF